MEKVVSKTVSVNGKNVVLNDDKILVLDALSESGYSREQILPREYKHITIEYNGKERKVHFGPESATKIYLNGERTSLLSEVSDGDKIDFEEFVVGQETMIKLSYLEEYNENIRFNVDDRIINLLRVVEVNGVMQFGDVEVKNGDVVEAYEFYTTEQLRETLGLEDDIILMHGDNEVLPGDRVFEGSILDTYVKYEKYDFINKRETPTFSFIIGDDYMYNNQVISKEEKVDELEEITVIMNGKTVELKNKKSYVVIDAMDEAGIDAMAAAGKKITITVNDRNASFSTDIADNDVVEFLYS